MTMDPQIYLQNKLQDILTTYGVPAISAVLVRDGGATRISAVRGVRKNDVAPGGANAVPSTDPFGVGSVSKPLTGYLMTYLIQAHPTLFQWTTTIAQVFPELNNANCRKRYGAGSDYLNATIEQLMSHTALLPYQPTNDYNTLAGNAVYDTDHLAEFANPASLRHRRYLYVVTSMQDPPVALPEYSGGSIVCAAMAERLMGISYEQLVQQHIFNPLGMTRSGFGRTCTTASPNPDGVFGHGVAPSGIITPGPNTTKVQNNFSARAPAGAFFCNADDLGTFMAANMPASGVPKVVVSDAMLLQAQAPPSAQATSTRGGWGFNVPSDPQAWHTGDIGTFCAALRIHTQANYGVAAMVNASRSSTSSPELGTNAYSAALAVLEDMHMNWSTLFL